MKKTRLECCECLNINSWEYYVYFSKNDIFLELMKFCVKDCVTIIVKYI